MEIDRKSPPAPAQEQAAAADDDEEDEEDEEDVLVPQPSCLFKNNCLTLLSSYVVERVMGHDYAKNVSQTILCLDNKTYLTLHSRGNCFFR